MINVFTIYLKQFFFWQIYKRMQLHWLPTYTYFDYINIPRLYVHFLISQHEKLEKCFKNLFLRSAFLKFLSQLCAKIFLGITKIKNFSFYTDEQPYLEMIAFYKLGDLLLHFVFTSNFSLFVLIESRSWEFSSWKC